MRADDAYAHLAPLGWRLERDPLRAWRWQLVSPHGVKDQFGTLREPGDPLFTRLVVFIVTEHDPWQATRRAA